MKHTDFYPITQSIKSHEYKELLAAIKAHNGVYLWPEDEEKPVIAINNDTPEDIEIRKVYIKDGEINLVGFNNEFGHRVHFDVDNVFTGHLSYIIDLIPATSKADDVTVDIPTTARLIYLLQNGNRDWISEYAKKELEVRKQSLVEQAKLYQNSPGANTEAVKKRIDRYLKEAEKIKESLDFKTLPVTNIKQSTLNKIMDTIQNNVTHLSISQIKALIRLIRIKKMEISGGELHGTPFILLPNNLGLNVQLIISPSPQTPYKVKYQLFNIENH